MHAHIHTGTQGYAHTYTPITSSLLARAACWITVNAFCAFFSYFLSKDGVQMSILLRSIL